MVWSWDAVHWNQVILVSWFGLLLVAVSLWMIFGKGFRKDNKFFPIFTLIFFPLMIGAIVLNEAHGPWDVMAEGTYDHATVYTTEHMSSHGARHVTPHTVVFFQDGRSYELAQVEGIPFPTGTHLRVLTKNGFYKFQALQPAP